jgi:hypothetical protein
MKIYTFIDFISAGVASETLYVTGCHPRLSRSLEDERSHALCVTDLLVSSSSRPLCCLSRVEKLGNLGQKKLWKESYVMIIGLPQAMFEHSAHLVCSCGLSMPPQAKNIYIYIIFK